MCKNQVQKQGIIIPSCQSYRSKDLKYYKNWTKETVFVCILGFIFHGFSCAKTDLNNNDLSLYQAHFLNKIILAV